MQTEFSFEVNRKPVPDMLLLLLIFGGFLLVTALMELSEFDVGFAIAAFVFWALFEIPLAWWLGESRVVTAAFMEEGLVLKYWNRKNTDIRKTVEIPYFRIKEVGKYMFFDRFNQEKGMYKVFIKQKQGGKKYVLTTPYKDYDKHPDFSESTLAPFYRECKRRGIKCC